MSLFFQSVQGYTPFQAGLRTMPATGMIVIVAPLAGRIAGRIGSKVPMAIGLAINALAMALLTTIDAATSYSHIWPPLLLAGVGMSLVMTPMTAAVMGAVPRERAGMASATSNASREIGGVFGIALLGAIVTHIFSRDLRRVDRGPATCRRRQGCHRQPGQPRRGAGRRQRPAPGRQRRRAACRGRRGLCLRHARRHGRCRRGAGDRRPGGCGLRARRPAARSGCVAARDGQQRGRGRPLRPRRSRRSRRSRRPQSTRLREPSL